MSSSLQTFVALAVVALAVAYLLYSWLGKRKRSGCGSDGCGAVSPEVKKLQAKLKHGGTR
jgi:hypothetical protein